MPQNTQLYSSTRQNCSKSQFLEPLLFVKVALGEKKVGDPVLTLWQNCVPTGTWTFLVKTSARPSSRWRERSWPPWYRAWVTWCLWTSQATSCWTTAQSHTLRRLWDHQGQLFDPMRPFSTLSTCVHIVVQGFYGTVNSFGLIYNSELMDQSTQHADYSSF